MDNEAKEPAAVTRGQNAMYLLPHDAAAAEEFLTPLLRRLDSGDDALQLLVITSDVETAGSLAAHVVSASEEEPLRVVPVVNPFRAERRVREGAHVVIGTASDLLGLVGKATLKLDGLRAVAVAWADALQPADVDALEALFAEVPKGAARVIVATEATDSVEALVERYARRPRRAAAPAAEETTAVNVGYIVAAAAGRPAVLRRVIDGLDPLTARVLVRTAETERAARLALGAMGYHGSYSAVTVEQAADAADERVDLLVLFDLPASTAALAEAAANAKRTIALVQPRQLASLRTLAGGGAVAPVTLPDVAARGQAEVAALRRALADELRAGGVGRELLVLEPLLEEHDPIELAAAALRLMGRATAGAGQVAATAGAAAAAAGPMSRIFVNVGEMDGARPGDLVGAAINEGGAQREQVGRVELRDKHAILEVASSVAEQVIERLNGSSIRGRRVQARLNQERPPRRDRDDRPPRGGGRGEERGGPRSFGRDRERGPERAPRERSFDRPPRDRGFDRPPRERSFDRPPREGGFDRPPRERSFDRPPRERSFDRPPRERGFDRDRGFGTRDRQSGGREGGRGPARPPRPRRGDT